ncbi:MAG TPA: hypothetical protein VGO14_04210 [Solirubrobacteraceae bacterium]|jgi:hypothetical protein|nr:hypothetical protein [Solirubrobacteraceae bacterium]
MRGFNPGRRILLGVCVLAIAAASVPLGAAAATPKVKSPLPGATTNGATHVLPTSALLTATIHPNGLETTYYFEYGPTTAYGSQTPQLKLAASTVKVKVGQAISGLQLGVVYHYRVLAINSAGKREGRDHTFMTSGSKLKFLIPKPAPDVFGSPMILSGTLTGTAGPNHRVALQASPYPYLESFTNIGLPAVTDRFGRFAFRVANLASNTEFRVVTLDALPVYSPVIPVQVAVRVTFSARSNPSSGLVRLYGTVTPAVPGARVMFQLLKAVRPGKNEEPTRYVSQFATTVKHGGRTFSRFSTIVKVRHGGRYRVFVQVRPGAFSSGFSTRTIVLHAAPSKRKK